MRSHYMIFSHPGNVCMTYWTHFCFSMSLSRKFAGASIGSFIHAFIPPLFLTHSSDTIRDMTATMKSVGCRD